MRADRDEPENLQLALAKHPIFGRLKPDAVASFLTAGRLYRYRPNAVIFMQGDPPNEVFFIIKGRVAISSTAAEGQVLLYAFLGPGDLFGELGVLGNMSRSATVEALDDCSIWGVSGKAFVRLVSEEPSVAQILLEALARQVVALNSNTEDLLFLDLKGRVAKRLLGLAGHPPAEASDVDVPGDVSQKQLAHLVGGTRENVSRVLSEFQRRGIVKRDGHHYTLTDVAALRRFAQVE
jgi:CRP/FNR family cyclic AMP-dependent transcriptional regulator